MAINLHIRYLIKLILISSLLFSCSPQKRLNRIIKNHPELLAKDTIKIIDTVIVENYNYDTTTIIKTHDTTTIINNERVILRYFYDTLRQEIYHEVECIGDTIIKETFIPIEKIVYKELTWWQKYGTLIIIIFLLLTGLLLLKKFGKIFI